MARDSRERTAAVIRAPPAHFAGEGAPDFRRPSGQSAGRRRAGRENRTGSERGPRAAADNALRRSHAPARNIGVERVSVRRAFQRRGRSTSRIPRPFGRMPRNAVPLLAASCAIHGSVPVLSDGRRRTISASPRTRTKSAFGSPRVHSVRLYRRPLIAATRVRQKRRRLRRRPKTAVCCGFRQIACGLAAFALRPLRRSAKQGGGTVLALGDDFGDSEPQWDLPVRPARAWLRRAAPVRVPVVARIAKGRPARAGRIPCPPGVRQARSADPILFANGAQRPCRTAGHLRTSPERKGGNQTEGSGAMTRKANAKMTPWAT